jgi:DNA invertase Pin-like site-specific DNA recombinase
MRIRRVLGYARVSSELQGQGSSLRDQQSTIAAYARAQGHPEPRFYVESESAIHEKNEKRDRIRALLADVKAGDLVLCDKIDRWSRDPEFTYRSIREILSAGASFYAVGDQCDPSTPEGDTMLNFRVLFAKEEHKRIKARMVGTRRLLRDQGYYADGLAPFGYRRGLPKGSKGPQKNVLVIEPKEAEIVRRAFRLATRQPLSSIAATLGLARDRVGKMLRKRVYLGEIQNTRGEWIQAKHPAIVDVDAFARARTALEGRKNAGASEVSETSTWILRDVARCARCGAKMTSAYAGPHGSHRRHYYRCFKQCAANGPRTRTGAFIPVGPLEAAAEPLILQRLEELRDELAREPKPATTKAPMADFAQRRSKLLRRRERYLEAYADGHMTREELGAAMAKLDAALLQVDGEELAATRPSPLSTEKVRRAVLREVGAIRKAWHGATPEARRKIVGHLAESALIVAGKPCEFVWRAAEELAG